MFKLEVSRIKKNPIFWLVIILGFILAVIPVIDLWPHGVTKDYYVDYPMSAYISWMFFTGNTYHIYSLIFPLLATLAYSDAYAEDFNSGFIKNILTKVNKNKYLRVRFIVNFLVGGSVSTFPLIVNFLGEMTAFPLIENNQYFGMPIVIEDSFWPQLFYSHPFLYVMLRMLIIFLFGGMLASLGLAFSTIIKNRYIVLIFPFLIVLIIDILLTSLRMNSLSDIFLWNVKASIEIPSFLIVGLAGTFIWYYVLGDKHETI
ncbi:hypothetical protein H5P36_16150 [Bacillus sp. APMAM]|uniref:hypothetical protein n=1 Tax=Margalitia sp. FSL K6-0131 TaxID=2954604 RepID=UPI000F895307|nr:hypothetical protein [Bacillus sp. APMAM]RTZ54905.1 hypothetical protein EKO25_15395 [Bacillus sp. SAJ1]